MLFVPLMLLALESSEVIALRTSKLMFGGEDAAREVSLMIGEKFDAAFQTTANLFSGVTGSEIIEGYRQRVAANADRLSAWQTKDWGRPMQYSGLEILTFQS
jgi:hypothetical protein